MNPTAILLVEDNEDDAFFMQQAVKGAKIENPFKHVEDGQMAINYLAGSGKFADRVTYPLPMVVFLDLKLPLKNGHEVLQWIRTQPTLSSLVVVVLSSSEEAVDSNRSYQLGANSYMVKPPAAQQLLELAERFKLCWLRQNRS